jgi:hypothetical protein
MNKYQLLNRSKANFTNLIAIIVIIISFVAATIVFLHRGNAPIGYENMWLLPFLYGILYYNTNIKYAATFKYIGISTLNVILFVRYIILPLFFSQTGIYFHSSAVRTMDDVNYLTIFLMIYEMVCIFLVLHYAIKKLDKQEIKIHGDKKLISDKNNIGYLITIIIGIVGFFTFQGIQERVNFIFINYYDAQQLNTIGGFCFLATRNTIPVLFLIFVSKGVNKYNIGQNSNKLLILFLAFITINVFWHTNRLTVLIQGIAVVALLNATNMFSKKLLIVLIGFIFVSVLSLSSFRWFGYGELVTFYDDTIIYFDIKMTSNYLQSYFGGPHLISSAIKLNYSLTLLDKIEVFINEMVSSIIFVKQIFPLSENSSMVFFNQHFGHYNVVTMLLPTVGQSYMYFGILGAPLLSVIFTLLLYKAEKALLLCDTIGEKFAFYTLVVWLAFFPMQNLNIVTANFFNKFLPLYLIVLANKRIKID